jgi:hypothetical protein
MFEGFRRDWTLLRDSKPGQRFYKYYRLHHGASGNRSRAPLTYLAGGLMVLLGLVALPAPGPGMIIIAIGGALIARESARVARVLDWVEVRLRRVLTRATRWWKRASTPKRIGLGLGAVTICGVAALGAYRVLFA